MSKKPKHRTTGRRMRPSRWASMGSICFAIGSTRRLNASAASGAEGIAGSQSLVFPSRTNNHRHHHQEPGGKKALVVCCDRNQI